MLVLTLVAMIVLALVDRMLAPFSIVAFEFAGDSARAEQILAGWGASGQRYAIFSLGFDFLYLVAYSTTIGCACIWAGETVRARGWALAALGAALAWGQWLAALTDSIENTALLRLLLATVEQPWPQIAWSCAALKFALVIAGLLYAGYGAAAWLTRPRAS
jgi:hypothetical protein